MTIEASLKTLHEQHVDLADKLAVRRKAVLDLRSLEVWAAHGMAKLNEHAACCHRGGVYVDEAAWRQLDAVRHALESVGSAARSGRFRLGDHAPLDQEWQQEPGYEPELHAAPKPKNDDLPFE